VTSPRISLEQHLSDQRRAMPSEYAGGVAAIISRLAVVAVAIERELAHAALRDRLGYAGGANATGDQVKKLDVWSHEVVVDALRKTGACAALVSEEAPEPIEMAEGAGPHGIVVCCDPVDGSSNLDVNGAVGTIFSLRPSLGKVPAAPAVLGPMTGQLAAGYVMYGPACTLVYTVGAGAHGFTLDRETGEFLLTHPSIQTRRRGKIYGINEGNIT
jgi:fructose-1,6-bisphosphatase